MDIRVGKIISDKRKEKSITQSDLAHFIGVSKASISKWETGQSLPDISLLPALASYFGISIDELMGYDLKMSDQEIQKLYGELSKSFASEPFEVVLNRCRMIIKRYYSCFPLLYEMGRLLINYSWDFRGAGNGNNPRLPVVAEAKEIFRRVKEESQDIELKQKALNLEATCAMMLDNPGEVIRLLEGIKPPPPHEGTLSEAYSMIGREADAKAMNQKWMDHHVHFLVEALTQYVDLFANDPLRLDEGCNRAEALIEAFQLKKMDATNILPFYLEAAQAYLKLDNGNKVANLDKVDKVDNVDKALSLLESYTEVVTSLDFPLVIPGGNIFSNSKKETQLDANQEEVKMPREEKTIKKDMMEAVTKNSSFLTLSQNPRFIILCEKLRLLYANGSEMI